MRTLPQSFVAGELSGRMFGRPDDPKYPHGAAEMLGFYVIASGAARRCPGTEMVREARNPDRPFRLVTFRATGGQDIQVELGFRQEYPTSSVPGYARFHRDGETVLHSVPWDATTAYVPGNLVRYSGQLYLCRLAHTNQVPTNVTYWKTLEYVPNLPFAAAAASPPTDGIVIGTPGEIYFGAGVNHNLETDDPVEFTGDAGTLAPGLGSGFVYGVEYFAIFIDAERIQIAATPGGPPLAIVNPGVGTFHRMHRRYAAGWLVSRSGSVFYCRTTRPIDGAGQGIIPTSGNETYWYQEPPGHEFEIPTTLNTTDAQLQELTFSSEDQTLSLATGTGGPYELTAIAPTGFDAYLTWRWGSASSVPPLPAPGNVLAVATKKGLTLGIVSLAGVGGGGTRTAINTAADHHLAKGIDFVYVENASQGTLNNKYWGVEDGGAANQFVVVDPDNGGYLTYGGAPGAAVGTVRRASLNSDTSNSYVVTAVDERERESLASTPVTVANNLFTTGAFNTITWNPVATAARYRVYRKLAAADLYGFLGESTATSLKDDGTIAPSLDRTPPILDSALPGSTPALTPQAVTHYGTRRVYAAGQDVWMSRSGTETDFSYSLPVLATDRIHERLKSPAGCSIRHLVPLRHLIALSDTTEFHIVPLEGGSITPDSFSAHGQTYVGAAPVQPIVMNDTLLFAAARGGHVFRLGFSDEGGGYVPIDVCDRATHLFDGHTIGQMARQIAPVPIAWHTSTSNLLLGMTFVPAQQVFAWHKHATDGVVESVSVGSEGKEDRVYLGVRRVINGTTKRFVERRASLEPVAWADSWFVDCGLRQETSAAVTVVTGLGHLEGETVAVFADGLVQAEQVVAGGQITLATPLPAGSNKVLVGLPQTPPELQTVPATFAVEAYASGRPKNVTHVWVRVEASGSFEIGPSLDAMVEPDEILPGVPYSGLVKVKVHSGWTDDGQIFIRQRAPLPLTIVSVTAEMAVAG